MPTYLGMVSVLGHRTRGESFEVWSKFDRNERGYLGSKKVGTVGFRCARTQSGWHQAQDEGKDRGESTELRRTTVCF